MFDKKEPYSVAIVAPTTFHYQVPLFRTLAEHPRIKLVVYICSDEAVNGQEVLRTYKTEGRWGIESEMLEAAENLEFERAAVLRDQVDALRKGKQVKFAQGAGRARRKHRQKRRAR